MMHTIFSCITFHRNIHVAQQHRRKPWPSTSPRGGDWTLCWRPPFQPNSPCHGTCPWPCKLGVLVPTLQCFHQHAIWATTCKDTILYTSTYKFYIILSLGCGFWWPVASMSTHKNLKNTKPIEGSKTSGPWPQIEICFSADGCCLHCSRLTRDLPAHRNMRNSPLENRAVVLQGTCLYKIESYHWHSSMFIENETEHTKALDSWAGPWRQVQEMVAGTSSVSEVSVLVVWFWWKNSCISR